MTHPILALYRELQPGPPPRVLLAVDSQRPDGRRRTLTLAPEIRDVALLEQIRGATIGSMVRVVVETDLEADELPSWITSFEIVTTEK
jgi:hypothetical protein